MIAASITGCVFVPIDPRTRGEKLAYMLRNVGLPRRRLRRLLPAGRSTAVRGAVPDLRLDPRARDAARTPARCRSRRRGRRVAARGARRRRRRPSTCASTSPNDPLQIIYTSGTTGDPKGVVVPERALRRRRHARRAARLPARRPALHRALADPRQRPGGDARRRRYMGLRAVFSRRFTKSRLWDVCRAHGCTTFSLLGGMATAIYSEPPRADDADNPVRMVDRARGMPAGDLGGVREALRRADPRVVRRRSRAGMAFKPIGEGPIGIFGKPVPGHRDEDPRRARQRVPARRRRRDLLAPGRRRARPASSTSATPRPRAKKTRGGWLRSGDMGHARRRRLALLRLPQGRRHPPQRRLRQPGLRREGDRRAARRVATSSSTACRRRRARRARRTSSPRSCPPTGARFDAAAVFAACRDGLEPNFVPTYLQVVDEIPKTASEKPQERFLLERFELRQAGPTCSAQEGR